MLLEVSSIFLTECCRQKYLTSIVLYTTKKNNLFIMNIKTFFSTLLLLCAMVTSAQNQKAQDNTIEAQFARVIDKSNNYQEYKHRS